METQTQMQIPRDFKTYYNNKRGDACKRGIDFLITLEEMWNIWCPYWEESSEYQTPGYRKYCLSRNGDTGPYSLSNCTIQTHSSNSKERWQTNRNFKPGKGDPDMNEYVQYPRKVIVNGVEYGSAGAAGKVYGIHKTTAHNRCESENFPDWQYLDAKRK